MAFSSYLLSLTGQLSWFFFLVYNEKNPDSELYDFSTRLRNPCVHSYKYVFSFLVFFFTKREKDECVIFVAACVLQSLHCNRLMSNVLTSTQVPL